MNVTDAAIVAAAKEWTRLMCGCYDPQDVPYLHDELRKILEAAAPHLVQSAKAEAWDEGCYEGLEWSPERDYKALEQNPYRKPAP